MPIETIHYELFGLEVEKMENKKDKNFLGETWKSAIVEINELISENKTEEEMKEFIYDSSNYPNIKKYEIALYHMKNALFNYAKLSILIK